MGKSDETLQTSQAQQRCAAVSRLSSSPQASNLVCGWQTSLWVRPPWVRGNTALAVAVSESCTAPSENVLDDNTVPCVEKVSLDSSLSTLSHWVSEPQQRYKTWTRQAGQEAVVTLSHCHTFTFSLSLSLSDFQAPSLHVVHGLLHSRPDFEYRNCLST